MNFYNSSRKNHRSNFFSPFSFCFIEATFDSFSFLTQKEKLRFQKHLNMHLAFVVSNKDFYKTNKLAKYSKQGDLQEKFMNNVEEYTPGMIRVIANYFDINICIAEDKCGTFTYTIYAPSTYFEQKPTIVLLGGKNGQYRLLYTEHKEAIINPHEYTDIKKFFTLYSNRQSNELLPYYKYKIKDLHKLAENFNVSIYKRGRGTVRIKKSKRELYSELQELI